MALSYKTEDIKLANVTKLHGLLDQVEAQIAETEAEKLKVEQQILDLKVESKPKQGYFTELAQVFSKAKEVDTTADKLTELELTLELLDQYLLDKTAEIFLEAEGVADAAVKEAQQFYTPYKENLSVKNAEETDTVGRAVNQLVIDVMTRYNNLLTVTKWQNLLAVVQPTYKGKTFKQLDLGLDGIVQLYGYRIKELVGGI